MTNAISSALHLSSNLYKAYNFLDTAKEYAASAKMLFKVEKVDTNSVFEKVLPTKYGGWRQGDSSDTRGIVRKRLENARKQFSLPTGTDFNNNKVGVARQNTKLDDMAQTSQKYCVYQITTDFLFDAELISYLGTGIAPQARDDIEKSIFTLRTALQKAQNLRSETHILIRDGHEIEENLTQLRQENKMPSQSLGVDEEKSLEYQDRYIQMSQQLTKNEHELKMLLKDIQQEFLVINKIKNLVVTTQKQNKVLNTKLDDFMDIVKNISFELNFDEDAFDFFCIREAIRTDPEFEFNVATLIYRMLYDPVSCYDLIISMGATGKALLSCLSTRSYLWGNVHSRRLLPDSAFAFFRLLGLKKESLQLILKKPIRLYNIQPGLYFKIQ